MRFWKPFLAVSTAALALVVAIGTLAPAAVAQVRAALVRNVDEPALQPFRTSITIGFTFINEQRLVASVPAGKRLVIDHISWSGFASTGGSIVFGGLRSSQFGPFVDHLEVHPPHASADSSFILQDGSQSGPVFFEPGEDVWLSVSATGTNRNITVAIQGHYVTL